MINLLPKKYIKNKAPMLVGIITGVCLVIMLLVIFIQLGIVKTQIKSANQTLMIEKQQTAVLNKEVKELQKSRSLKIREELASIKGLQYDTAKVMNTFAKTNNRFDIGVLAYQLDFIKIDRVMNNSDRYDVNEAGQPIIKVEFATEETSLKKLGHCIEAFREETWVDDAKFVMMSHNSAYNSTIFVNLLVDELPTLGGK